MTREKHGASCTCDVCMDRDEHHFTYWHDRTIDDEDGVPHKHTWSGLHDAAGYRQCLGSDCWATLAPDGEIIDDDG